MFEVRKRIQIAASLHVKNSQGHTNPPLSNFADSKL